jgi:adenosine deaminase
MTPRFHIEGLTHDHVDGSIAVLDILTEMYDLAGTPRSKRKSPAQARAYFDNVHDDLVNKFSFSTSLLRSAEALELMGYAYGKRRAMEGYVYVEAQFAPEYAVTKDNGLSIRSAIHHMIQGFRKAQTDTGIRIMPVVDIDRASSPKLGMDIAKAVLDYDGAVMLGLACVEAGNPPEKHQAAYELTFGSKVRRTCHAGEWVERRDSEPVAAYRARLLANVRTAIRVLKCHDIGHAIPLCDDDELIREVVGEGIRISGSPLSNLTTGQIKDVRELQIDKLLDAGVYYTLNADDDLFLPDMEQVIKVCDSAYKFTDAQIEALQMNALLFHRFDPEIRLPKLRTV